MVVVGNRIGCRRLDIAMGSLGECGTGVAVGFDRLAKELATAAAEGEGSRFLDE